MPNTPSPNQQARLAERELKAAANIHRARQTRSYFKAGEEIWLFGVDTPTQRRIASGLFQRVRGAWAIGEAILFCGLLIKRREMELNRRIAVQIPRRPDSQSHGLDAARGRKARSRAARELLA